VTIFSNIQDQISTSGFGSSLCRELQTVTLGKFTIKNREAQKMGR